MNSSQKMIVKDYQNGRNHYIIINNDHVMNKNVDDEAASGFWKALRPFIQVFHRMNQNGKKCVFVQIVGVIPA